VTITNVSTTAVKDDVLDVSFDGQNIKASLRDGETLKAGTYKYTFTGYVYGNKVSKQFSVKVVNANRDVQLRGSGNINLANANEYMTITPTLKNTTAAIVGVQEDKITAYKMLDNKGNLGDNVSDQFNIELLEDGKLKLTYDGDVEKKLVAKQKYKITVVFDLDDGTTLQGNITVTPIFKLTTPKTKQSKVTFYKNCNNTFETTLTTTSKTGTNAISKIVFDDTAIIKGTGKTASELFKVGFDTYNDINLGNVKVTISLADAAKTPQLKNTKVTALVYYESGTTEKNNTPAKVTFTVTVK
jgi:hypothetical protein